MKRSSWLLRLRIARGDDPPRLSYRVAQKSASGHQTLGREHDEDHGLGFDSGDGLQQPRTERTFERVEAPDWLGQLPTRLATRPKAGRRRVNATGRSVGVLLSTPASLVAVTAVVVDLLPQKRPRLGAVRECVKPPDVVNLRHLRPVRGARNREKVGPCPIRPPPAPSSRGRPARRFSPARVTARRTLRPPRSHVEKSIRHDSHGHKFHHRSSDRSTLRDLFRNRVHSIQAAECPAEPSGSGREWGPGAEHSTSVETGSPLRYLQ